LQARKNAHAAGSRRTYDWPRPAVTVDIAVFTVTGGAPDARLEVLLIRRDREPFQGAWALPGGFVHEHEDLPAAAARELLEETGVRDAPVSQVGAIGTPARDPRGHTVTVLNVALVAADRHRLAPTGDTREARWFDVRALPPLAFDHAALLRQALEHLRAQIAETPVLFELLPREFTLSELQALCEALLERKLDTRNFRRKIEECGFVVPAKGRREGAHRPAQLYKLAPAAFARHVKRARAQPFR
jgi:8-oxo-dGTP diphosphatase